MNKEIGKIIFTTATLLFVIFNLFAGQSEKNVTLKTKTGTLEGTLLIPETKTMIPVALIIAGSGPTDRDGNNPVMKNNSLKMLANELSKNGINKSDYRFH